MITKEFIDEGKKNRPGIRIAPKFITIHNTSNAGRGANAKAHSKFVRNTGFYLIEGRQHWVSWHFTVDDKDTIQHLPITEKGFHAGSGNSVSIGVEICMHQDIDQTRAFDNAADLAGSLLRDLGLEAAAVRTHKSWTGKACPTLLLGTGAWANFIRKVEAARAMESDAPVVTQSEIDRAGDDVERDTTGDDIDLDHDLLIVPQDDDTTS